MIVLERELAGKAQATTAIQDAAVIGEMVEETVDRVVEGRLEGVVPILALDPVTKTANWAAVSGADAVEVSSGRVQITASETEAETLSDLSVSKSGQHHTIVFGRDVRLVSLTLNEFTFTPIGATDSVDFSASKSARLVISLPHPKLLWLPLYAVPPVESSTSPRQYYGASMDGRTVKFPSDVPVTDRVRISVVNKFAQEGENLLSHTIGGVSARVLNLPEDLAVTNETDDGVIFEHEGLYLNGTPATTLDMVNHAQAAFDRQLAEGVPLSFQYKIAAKRGAFRYTTQSIRGALVRTFSGVTTASLAGEPLALPLDLTAGPLAGERPDAATADLTLTYEGLRLLPRYNDRLPGRAETVTGRVVREAPVGRLLLDPEIASHPITRLGLIGRAPETCELSVWLAERQGERPGEPLTDPGVVELAPGVDLQIVWVDLPEPLAHPGAVFLQVRANTGRFFWVTDPDPLLRVVVLDPEPGNRPVMINDIPLSNVDAERIHRPAVSLLTDLWRNTPPILTSELFVTVEWSDLTLRYER